jgi:hypothetical protein
VRVYHLDRSIKKIFGNLEKNFEYLGSGSFGDVYSDGKFAYKDCAFNSNYVKWLLFLRKNKQHKNPYAPKVISIYVEKSKKRCIVKMELLRHGPVMEMSKKCNKIFNTVIEFQEWGGEKKRMTKLDWISKNIADFLDKHKSCLDLHADNVMMRKKQLVITDPVV